VPGRVAKVIVERVGDLAPAPLPVRATKGSACFDLACAETVVLTRRRVTLVRTGLKMRAPAGTFLEVRPRSGLSTRGVLMANAPGTIDRDYSGEIRVPLTYLFSGRYTIRAGDRIGQIRVVEDRPATFVTGRVVPRRSRSAGFGSTGR
jgi:dUTP pyrophosphatase